MRAGTLIEAALYAQFLAHLHIIAAADPNTDIFWRRPVWYEGWKEIKLYSSTVTMESWLIKGIWLTRKTWLT